MSTTNHWDDLLKEIRKIIREELQAAQSPLANLEEAANFLRVKPKTLRNYLSDKENPFPVRPVKDRGPIRFKKDELKRYVESL